MFGVRNRYANNGEYLEGLVEIMSCTYRSQKTAEYIVQTDHYTNIYSAQFFILENTNILK